MRLLAHPATPRGQVQNIEVRAELNADKSLRLSWRLDADLTRLRVPLAAAPGRADGLWRHTCFETFIAGPETSAYCELNFSPSGKWAAYRFTGYRTGMTPLDLLVAPEVRWRRAATHLELDVTLGLGDLFSGSASDPLRLAIAAVVEEQSGTISYWALRHPVGKPDFHHAEGFALELASSAAGAGRGAESS